MHRKILMLAILALCAVFGVSAASFAQSLNTFEDDDPELARDMSAEESQARVDANVTEGWVIEKNAGDAYPGIRGKSRATERSNRFFNPHPELGCLYYDENDKRHWFPGCREL